jgi:GNAT superfamily N-acetyltransferase
MVEIKVPSTNEDLDAVRLLMRSFVTWHRQRHEQDLQLINDYFDPVAFENELSSLPGKYAPPDGALLLASIDGLAAGCVALRRIDEQSCEMKRMFIYAQHHGQGLGRALGEAIVREGQRLGYSRMLLDTSIRQVEAQTLYRKLGFRVIDPYYELPTALKDWLVFMERAL